MDLTTLKSKNNSKLTSGCTPDMDTGSAEVAPDRRNSIPVVMSGRFLELYDGFPATVFKCGHLEFRVAAFSYTTTVLVIADAICLKEEEITNY